MVAPRLGSTLCRSRAAAFTKVQDTRRGEVHIVSVSAAEVRQKPWSGASNHARRLERTCSSTGDYQRHCLQLILVSP